MFPKLQLNKHEYPAVVIDLLHELDSYYVIIKNSHLRCDLNTHTEHNLRYCNYNHSTKL